MSDVTETGTAADLRTAIERSGYYPELVAESLETALAGEDVRAFLVHHEATFDHDELRRHITVLALTATRLVVAHTDDDPADEVTPPTRRPPPRSRCRSRCSGRSWCRGP